MKRVSAVCVLALFMLACAVPASALALGSISGTVTAATGGAPLSLVEVCAEGEESFECTLPEADGTYTIDELEAGDYTVEFWPFGEDDYLLQFYDGKATWEEADPVTVEDAVDTPGIDAVLLTGGRISGTVTDAVTKAGVEEVEVCAYPVSAPGYGRCGYSEGAGQYTVRRLAPGSYELVAFDEFGLYLEQAYPGLVNVTATATTPGIDFALSKPAPPVAPPPAQSTPAPVTTPVATPVAPVVKPRPKPRCPKGKRLVKRKGKSKCVKIQRKGKYHRQTH